MSTATYERAPRKKLSLNDPGVALAAAAVLLLPLWAPWQSALAVKPHHEFYPILAFGMIFLIRHRLSMLEDPTATPGKPVIAGLLAAISLPCLFVGYVMPQALLMCIGTVVAFSMVLYSLGGWRLWRHVAPVFTLLALITPPPGQLDSLLTLKLQQLSVMIASRVLDMFKIFHVVNTNTLEVDGQRFLVEEACSGIQSLFSILAFALFYAIWNERGFLRAMLLLAGALAFDLSLNVLRICLGVIAKITGDINLLDGWPHEILGIVVFVMGLGLTLSWDVVLDELAGSKLLPTAWLSRKLRRIMPGGKSSGSSRSGRSSDSSRRSRTEGASIGGGSLGPFKKASIGVMVVWAVLVVPMTALSAIQLPRYLGENAPNADDPVRRALDTRGEERLKLLEELTKKSRNTFSPPAKIGDWTLLPESTKSSERTMSFGSKSESFVYFNGKSTVQISIDYPFFGFHDLNICYDVGGWQVRDMPLETIGSTEALPYNVSVMSRGIDQKAVMIYSAFLDDGAWRLYRPEQFFRADLSITGESSALQIARNRVSNRLKTFVASFPDMTRRAFFSNPTKEVSDSYTNYQIQALSVDTDEITDEKRQALEAFFREAAPMLRDEFLRAKVAGGVGAAGEQPAAETK